MGMYNEVSHECPQCRQKGQHALGQGHVSQIGPGFGGYCLSSLLLLKFKLEDAEVTPAQLKRIAQAAATIWFCCDKCEHAFKADSAVLLAVSMLADRFVTESTDDTISRASAMLKDIYPD